MAELDLSGLEAELTAVAASLPGAAAAGPGLVAVAEAIRGAVEAAWSAPEGASSGSWSGERAADLVTIAGPAVVISATVPGGRMVAARLVGTEMMAVVDGDPHLRIRVAEGEEVVLDRSFGDGALARDNIDLAGRFAEAEDEIREAPGLGDPDEAAGVEAAASPDVVAIGRALTTVAASAAARAARRKAIEASSARVPPRPDEAAAVAQVQAAGEPPDPLVAAAAADQPTGALPIAPAAAAPTEPVPRIRAGACATCGAELRLGAAFCARCGSAVGGGPRAATPAQTVPVATLPDRPPEPTLELRPVPPPISPVPRERWCYVTHPVETYDVHARGRAAAALEPGRWYVALREEGGWLHVRDVVTGREAWAPADRVTFSEGPPPAPGAPAALPQGATAAPPPGAAAAPPPGAAAAPAAVRGAPRWRLTPIITGLATIVSAFLVWAGREVPSVRGGVTAFEIRASFLWDGDAPEPTLGVLVVALGVAMVLGGLLPPLGKLRRVFAIAAIVAPLWLYVRIGIELGQQGVEPSIAGEIIAEEVRAPGAWLAFLAGLVLLVTRNGRRTGPQDGSPPQG